MRELQLINSPLVKYVPSNWTWSKLKFVASINGRIGFRGYTVNDIVNEGEGAITLSPSNIEDGKLKLNKLTYLSWDKYYESPEIMIDENHIIFCKTGSSYGKVAIIKEVKEPMTLNPQLVVIKPYAINPSYLAYLMESSFIRDQVETIVGGGTMPTISQESLLAMNILIPTKSEQKSIVDYLEKKCSEIDTIIGYKNILIKLLEQQRQSIITEAVTKGLNPNVKMKDSGIERIGEIPKLWDATKIIYYSKLLTGGTPDKDNSLYWENGDISWMVSGEVNKEFVYEVNSKITELGMRKSAAKVLPVNSVMMALNGQGKTKGKVAVLKTETTCNQSLAAFVCNEDKLHYLYLYYYLKSKYKEIRGLVGDGLRDGISLGLLKSLRMPLPPVREQQEIANYLYNYDVEINKLISKSEDSIKLLKEYRKSLVYEAVTGKIDVRELELN